MHICGLHILDVGIIVLYVIVLIWLGTRVGRDTTGTEDFFIAGRSLGKFYQFFLNFGCSTDANQAAGVSREIYRQGIGGMWIQYLVLFLTPFYWFTTMLYRRSRLITIGDFFTERFQSPFLGGAFAVFTLIMAIIGGGASFMVVGKTVAALTPKPAISYTASERQSVDDFREYRLLRETVDDGLGDAELIRYAELHERAKRGELKAIPSYTNPLVCYIVYGFIVAVYTVLGGFKAAAVTDAIQGVLIIAFSCMLIPLGLREIGGFSGLHATVPDYMFALFGSAATSEYAWFTIIAMIFANLVSIIAVAPMMATPGSARNEMTARIGMIGGMFCKRIIMLFWALAGLLAIGLYAGQLDDPDHIWGYMTQQLLFPGAIGLMLAGILAANMSTLDAGAVTQSALFIRNLYQPMRPGRSDKHYMNVGRVVIVVILVGGVVTAKYTGNLLDLFKYFISLPAIFGAAIWLGFVWRRLTRWAVIIQVAVCFSLFAVVPTTFPHWPIIRDNPAFLAETVGREVVITTGALKEDVDAGLADRIGERIDKSHRIEPAGIFFEKVVLSDPSAPASAKIGQGRFQAEIWILSWFGVEFIHWSKAQLVTLRFLVDAILPFVLLFAVSAITKPIGRKHLDRFYGKVHTPVQATLEEDEQAVAYAALHPEVYEYKKLKRGSNWEILRPGWIDVLGFGGSWILVGGILFLLWLLVTIGS